MTAREISLAHLRLAMTGEGSAGIAGVGERVVVFGSRSESVP